MSRLCDKAGVKRFGFHAIRHLTATSLYHKGYGVEAIQAALRHKHATTTNQYVKTLGLEQLRTVLDEGLSHPKGKVIEMKKSSCEFMETAVQNEKAVKGAVNSLSGKFKNT